MQNNNYKNGIIVSAMDKDGLQKQFFSCIKRMFGEYVTAIRLENMVKEHILKASLYNWFQSIVI